MKNHITLVEQYYVQQKEHELKKITKNEKLKLQIKQSKDIPCIHFSEEKTLS